jgi:hypothetical protein
MTEDTFKVGVRHPPMKVADQDLARFRGCGCRRWWNRRWRQCRLSGIFAGPIGPAVLRRDAFVVVDAVVRATAHNIAIKVLCQNGAYISQLERKKSAARSI